MALPIKFLFATVALFFYSLVAGYAQGYFPAIEWSRCYGSSENEDAIDIKQTFDGGYVVLGTSASTDGDLLDAPFGAKTWVFKLDSDGDIEWHQYLMNVSAARNIEQTNDGGFIISGNRLTKLAGNGDIDWQFNIASTCVIQVSDGGYVSLYKNHNSITKISEQQNIVWQYTQTYNSELWTNYYAEGNIVETRDSGLVLVGKIRFGEQPVMSASWILKLNKHGVVEVNKSSEVFLSYKFVKVTLDGNYVMFGTMTPITDPTTNLIVKSDTNLRWQEELELPTSDIIENIDTTYVLCGTKQINTSSDAYVSKRNSSGQHIVTREYGGTSVDNFKKIVSTDDTGYIAIGATWSNDGDVISNHGKRDIWVVKFKTDTSVHVPPPVLSTTGISKVGLIKVYPNPTSGLVNISLPQGLEGAEISVYNIVGQAVEFETSGAGRVRNVQLSNLPAGQYILQVRNGVVQKTFRITLNP